MMNAWEPSNINKVIGVRWSRKTMGQVNEFPLSVMDMSNKYRERWKISMKKISALMCVNQVRCISKSHKAAELGIHVITSIQEVLTA